MSVFSNWLEMVESGSEDHLRQGVKVSPWTSAFAGSISGLVAR